jgi:competence protein ComEC
MAGWPLASVAIDQAVATWLALGYGLLLGAAWLGSRRGKDLHRARAWLAARRGRWPATLIVGLSLAAAVLAWLAVLQLPDGRLHVAFLDIGQGDAILITMPSGQQILVDGGPSPADLTTALGREMPFWDRSLDAVVMTHADADHITGLVDVLDRTRVDHWLDSGQPDDDPLYVQCQRLLEEKGVPRHAVQRGSSLVLEQGIVLEVLHPPPEAVAGTEAGANNSSVVLRLAWGKASFLLTGDIEAEAEQVLLESGQPLQATVLKVAHHGSGGSSTAGFLSAAAPRYAVISAGADNRFGHPQEAVLDRLAALGDVTVLRTDQAGTVEFVTDGQRLWVRTKR